MNFLEAQKDLATSITSAARNMNSYFWRLSGDEPNSLCKFLCMPEEDLKVILRLCKIYTGARDNVSKKNFEALMTLLDNDFTRYQMKSKLELFIKIGKCGKVDTPHEVNNSDGSPKVYPVEGLHFQNLRTKSQRGLLPKLLDVGRWQIVGCW